MASARSPARTSSASRTTEQLFTGRTHSSTPPCSTTSSGWPSSMFIATPLGIFLAVLLDREIRGTRFYQTVFYLPVVLSLAVIGIIWQFMYTSQFGFIDSVLRALGVATPTDWYGDRNAQPVGGPGGGQLAPRRLRHGPLPGRAKSVDPSLREAATVDGANERQTFFRVVFPVMLPINIVIVVITDDRVPAGVRHRLHHQQRQERPRAAVDADHQQQHQRGEPRRLRLGHRRRPARRSRWCRSSSS